MINFFILQFGFSSGLPPLDFSVLAERMVLSLLARRLFELFLNIGIRFGFGSFGIRFGMAGPVIAIDLRRHRETGRRRAPRHLLNQTLAIDCERKLKLESKI